VRLFLGYRFGDDSVTIRPVFIGVHSNRNFATFARAHAEAVRLHVETYMKTFEVQVRVVLRGMC
jgi:hypothetical protein